MSYPKNQCCVYLVDDSVRHGGRWFSQHAQFGRLFVVSRWRALQLIATGAAVPYTPRRAPGLTGVTATRREKAN